jgi:8-oxo-dGTP pyrophosphatase MutT (NUDIX family)
MRIVTSAGILIKSGDKFLLAHSTGQKIDKGWGLPKGRVEEGETEEQAAIRETKEECGLDVKESDIKYLTEVSYNSKDEIGSMKKTLKIFLYETDESLQNEKFYCSTYFNPPWSKNKNVKLPEVDKFKWVTAKEGRSGAMNSIKRIFDVFLN